MPLRLVRLAALCQPRSRQRDIAYAKTKGLAMMTETDAAPISVGAIWKSPRDRTRAIEATLREFNGHAFADFRMMVMDGGGRAARDLRAAHFVSIQPRMPSALLAK